MTYEVGQPILNGPFDEPSKHWCIQRGRDPKIIERRRDAFAFGPKNRRDGWVSLLRHAPQMRPAGAGSRVVGVARYAHLSNI